MDSDEPTETYFISDSADGERSTPSTGIGFVVTEGPLAGSRFLLDRKVSTLGRHPKSDLFLMTLQFHVGMQKLKSREAVQACVMWVP